MPACYGECASDWPPLRAAEGARPEGDFGLMRRADGAMQWTFRGRPLSLWINDQAPAEVTGDGVRGLWHLVQPAE